MAVTMRTFAPAASVAPRRASVKAAAARSGEADWRAPLAAAAAAVLLNAAPASAGVILEQPQLKKVLQADAPAAPAPKREIILPGQRKNAAAKQAAAPAAKAAKPEVSVQGGDLDPRAVALPGTLALIAGGAFALTKVDEEFADFMVDASCKNSSTTGAGYETDLKGGALAMGGKKAGGGSKAGTKKVKAATKSGTKSGSPLDLFK